MIILVMYINMTNFTAEQTHVYNEGLQELADRLKQDGIRMILMPVRNNSGFINKVECVYPHFVVMNKDEIEKIENLDRAVKDSLNIDAIIETLMKRIYPEK
jgi:deoxyribodipyrimidine photolyase